MCERERKRERERERSLVTMPASRCKSGFFQAALDMWSPIKWKLGSIIFISLAPVSLGKFLVSNTEIK